MFNIVIPTAGSNLPGLSSAESPKGTNSAASTAGIRVANSVTAPAGAFDVDGSEGVIFYDPTEGEKTFNFGFEGVLEGATVRFAPTAPLPATGFRATFSPSAPGTRLATPYSSGPVTGPSSLIDILDFTARFRDGDWTIIPESAPFPIYAGALRNGGFAGMVGQTVIGPAGGDAAAEINSVLVDPDTGPAVVNCQARPLGKPLIIFDAAGNCGVGNEIVVTPPAGELIDGAATRSVSTAFGGVTIMRFRTGTDEPARWKTIASF